MKHARSLGCTVTSAIAASLPAASASCHEMVGQRVDDRVGRIDGDAVGELGCRLVADDLDRARREVALHHEHLRARIGELMPEELALVRGVDRHLHGTQLQGGEEADDLLGAVLEQRRDPVAGCHTELAHGVGETIRLPVHLARRQLHALTRGGEIEVRTLGIGGEALGERCEDGGLRPRHGHDSSVRNRPRSWDRRLSHTPSAALRSALSKCVSSTHARFR